MVESPERYLESFSVGNEENTKRNASKHQGITHYEEDAQRKR
jgi:hypothetical protein